MKQVNIGQPAREGSAPKQNKPSISVSPNPTRTSERIDIDGNVIDPRTKRIIRPAGN